MEGWIKLHRQVLDWEWWNDINTFRLFMYILLEANWSEKKWQGKVIHKGELITSLNKLATNTGLTIRQTRTALDNLKTTHEIEVDTSARNYTIIRVCKFADYQGFDESDKQTTHEMSMKRQTNDTLDDKQTTTTKEYKEYKNNNSMYVYNNAHAREETEPRVIGHLNVKTSESKKLFADKVKLKRA
jgi:hypothetical protein